MKSRELLTILSSALMIFIVASLHAHTPVSKTKQPGATSNPSPTPPPSEEIDPGDVIRVKTSLVNSPVLVIGRNGKYVPSLKQQDFQVYEDGVRQEIAYFAAVDKPVMVTLLLDISRSAVFNLNEIQDAALAFVNTMRPQDKAQVIVFADEIRVLAEPTSDRRELRRAIRSSRPGGATRLYDALDFVLTNLAKAVSSNAERQAVLLFSDGVDNASQAATYESSALRVQKSDVLVYPIQFNSYEARTKGRRTEAPVGSGFSKQDYARADAYLRLLADLSATGVYVAAQIMDLDRAVSKIVDELHNEYSIGYYPRVAGSPGDVRKVEVRVNQRQLVVRARAGYVVDGSGSPLRTVKSLNLDHTSAPSENGSPGASLANDPRPQLGARWICKGPHVPTDFAVVLEGFDEKCPMTPVLRNQVNAWFIRKPRTTEKLCKGFMIWNGREVAGAPVPTGYVVTGETQSDTCAKSSTSKSANAWTIRLPQGRETICKGFVIPRGYIVINEVDSAGCPIKERSKNAWTIQVKE